MATLEADLMCEDIESLLMNREEMSLYLKKLKESCDSFSTKIHLKVQDLIFETSGNLEFFYCFGNFQKYLNIK